MLLHVTCRSMKETDKNFLQQKETLIERLEELVDYLGDDDAKQVSLDTNTSSLQLDTVSANSEKHDKRDLADSV